MKLILNIDDSTGNITGFVEGSVGKTKEVAPPQEASEKWEGSIDPRTMTVYDWAFFSKNPALWSKVSTIFDRAYEIKDPDSGRLLHGGDLATVDTSAYASNGGVLAKYV